MSDLTRSINKNRQDELDNLGFLKIILMAIIVLYHSFYVWGTIDSNWTNIFVPTMSAPIMPHIREFFLLFHTRVFMMISGYLFFYLKHECDKYKKFGGFLLGKVLRLVVPSILVSLLIIAPVKIFYFKVNWQDILLGFARGLAMDQTWFLMALFMAFIVIYLMDKFIYKHHFISGGILLIVSAASVIFMDWASRKDISINYLNIFNGLEFAFYLYLGYKIRQFNFRKLREFKWYWYLLIILGLFAFSECLYTFCDGFISKIGIGLRYVYYYIFPILVFYMFQGIGDKVNKNTKVFKFLSRRTMGIYLTHQVIIYFCLAFIPEINPWLNGSLNFVISITLALAITSLLLLTTPTAFILGEKKINRSL